MKTGMVFDMDLMVCVGSSCHLQNSRDLINRLKELIAENRLDKNSKLPLASRADEGVCVKFADEIYSLTMENVDDFFVRQVVGKLEG